MRGKDFWGAPTWMTIHVVAYLSEPDHFLWELTRLLPCEVCRKNLTKKLKALPPQQYSNRGASFFYSYLIHDLANQHISKFHPETPKISPPFEVVKKAYENIVKDPKMWGGAGWITIHSLASTLDPQNALAFERMLEDLLRILPETQIAKKMMDGHPIRPYLRNNHDAFFYTYILHDFVNRKLGKVSPCFDDVKAVYFSATGDCENCKV